MNPFQSYRFFSGMRIRHLALLITCAADKRYKPGEVLFHARDPVRHFVLIKSGAVALRTPNARETHVKTARSGDVLGWSCLDPQAVWDSTGQAVEPTTVTTLDAARLQVAASENPDFGRELSRRIAQWNNEALENDHECARLDLAPLPGTAVQYRRPWTPGRPVDLPGDILNLSPADAEELSVQDGQWVQLTGKNRDVIIPVRIKPDAPQSHPVPSRDWKVPAIPAATGGL